MGKEQNSLQAIPVCPCGKYKQHLGAIQCGWELHVEWSGRHVPHSWPVS